MRRCDIRGAVAAAIVVALLAGGGSAGATVAPAAAVPADTWVTDGAVYAVAADASHYYLGGHFTLVGPRTGSGVALDPVTGARDAAFAAVSGGAVRSVVDDGSGGYFIGGDFTRVAGVLRHGLAHVRADGSLDTAWRVDADRSVRALARVGSRLFVAGTFANIGGVVQPGLAAVDAATGVVDTAWDPDVLGPVNALTASGGTLYAGGEISTVDGVSRGSGAAFDVATGALLSWDPHVEFRAIDALAVDGGYVYVGGEFSVVSQTARYYLVRVDAASGALDGNWRPEPSWPVHALLAAGGRLYVGGEFDTIAGAPRHYAAAFDLPSGTLSAWAPEPDLYVLSLASAGSRVFLGGRFTAVAGTERFRLAAVDAATGALDSSFDPRANRLVFAIAASSTRIYAGGDFASVNGVRRDNLAALDRSTGAVDAGWRVDVTGTGNTVADLALDGAGRLYVAGYFGSLGGAPISNLGSVDAATGIVYRWNPQADGGVRSIVFAAGRVVVCGWFSHIGGATGQVAALDPSSGTAAWAVAADDDVFRLAALGNTVYVAGEYATIAGAPRSSLAAVDAASGALLSWAPRADRSVWAIAATPQRVYFGGTFDSVDGILRHEVAAVDSATGAVVTSWVPPGDNSTVFSVASDGSRVFVGGDFSRMGSREVNELVELDAATGAVTSWTPTPDFTVRDIYLDGDILVGGDIDNYSRLQEGFAAFGATGDGTAPETSITTSPATTTSDRNATFTFASSEPGSTFWCAVDDATPYGSCSSPTSFVGFGLGTHTFHVYATDAAGNADTTPVSYTWSIEAPTDTTPPDTTISSGPAASTARTDATFAFASSEAGSTFACSLDGGGWAPCSSPQTYAGLAVGGHSFGVRATDAAGNTDPTPAAWSWQVVPPAPANDMFVSAQTLAGGSGSVGGTTVGATKETGEPAHAGDAGGHSVWYRWRAPARAFVTFSTSGSGFDTLLAVYEGSSVSALSVDASNDNASTGTTTSSVRFRARAGVTYSIAVDGKNGAAGPLTLSWSP